MGEETEDFRETMRLEDIEELECFLKCQKRILQTDETVTYHFETETSINHQQYEINDLAEINHTVEVVATLNKGDTPGLSRDHRDGSLRLV